MDYKRILFCVLCIVLTIGQVVYGSSDNSVNKTLSVKSDYTFTPGKGYAYLRIQESSANDFEGAPVTFQLRLTNAEWFDAGEPATDPAGPDQIENDTLMSDPASSVNVRKRTSRVLEVTITRGGAATDKAWWRIPLYAEVTKAGTVSVEVDGSDGLVTSEVLSFAEAFKISTSGSSLVGHVFTAADAPWVIVREPEPGAFAVPQTFSLVLTNAKWRPESDKTLGPAGIKKDIATGGIEGNRVVEVKRLSDTELQITLERGTEGSAKGKASWSIPLYCEITAVGDVSYKVVPKNSLVETVIYSKTKMIDPIRYKTQLTLTLNQMAIEVVQGNEQNQYTLDVAPVNPKGNTLVPVRGIFEHLGSTVSWNAAERVVTVKKEGQEIEIPIGNDTMVVDGLEVALPEPAQIINNRTYLPLRVISEELGLEVTWIEATKQILIQQD